MGRTLSDAFGGRVTTLEDQRAIWAEALHEDAIWEGPTFEAPIQTIGREATGRFMELLLQVVPRFSTTVVASFPTSDPETMIFEAHGGGETVSGGRYTQRYFTLLTMRGGQAFRMREYCNPFQTYKAFGKEAWTAATAHIMTTYNRPWPASQPRDPITLPPC
jgi:ketosteroid isomerase-like protein